MKTSLGGLYIFSCTPLQRSLYGGNQVTFTMEEAQVLILGMRILLQTPVPQQVNSLRRGVLIAGPGSSLPA